MLAGSFKFRGMGSGRKKILARGEPKNGDARRSQLANEERRFIFRINEAAFPSEIKLWREEAGRH